MGIGRLAAAGAAALATAMFATAAWAEELVGQPTPGGIGLQPAASPLKVQAHWFHDGILMPIISAICLFVLALLLWVIVRYNKRANPTPARWSHNTLIEIVWTVVPVLILMFIAVFSFRLLYAYHDMPKPDLTVKVTGNQWNWTYEYPDQGVGEYVSNMLPEDEAKAAGRPYRLAADEPMVVPVGKTVRLIVTGSDVVHAVAVPAFGVKTDAVPGKVNETWFRADREGVYYGVCYELCGAQHGYMPIAVEVVSRERFNQWVLSRGGHLAAPGGAEGNATAAAPAPAAAAAPPATATAASTAPTGNVTAGAEAPATTNQSATTNR